MLVKLDVGDLQFEKMNPFEGTMAYAQNKRQQVVMTKRWAEKYKATGIHFSSMHPGITKLLNMGFDGYVLTNKQYPQLIFENY